MSTRRKPSAKKRRRKARRRHARKRQRQDVKALWAALTAIVTHLERSNGKPVPQTWYETTRTTDGWTTGATPVRCRICRRFAATQRSAWRNQKTAASRRARRYSNDDSNLTCSTALLEHGEKHRDIIEAMDQGLFPVPNTALDRLEAALGRHPSRNGPRGDHITLLLCNAGAQRFDRVFVAPSHVVDIVEADMTLNAKLWALNRITTDNEFKQAIAAAATITGGAVALVEAQVGHV
jgi:hypothetical protein